MTNQLQLTQQETKQLQLTKQEDEKKFAELFKEQSLLRTISLGYRSIRQQFLATYERDYIDGKTKGQYQTITEGNQRAHHGDAVVDALVCQDGVSAGPAFFSQLYGLTWQQVIDMGKHFPYPKFL